MMRVAVATTGGDAPGLNAAIRAVARTAINRRWDVLGIRHGYAGLVNDDMVPLGARDVGGIIKLGGTILHSRRWPAFTTPEAQEHAVQVLANRGVHALIVIGGDGSQAGALALANLGVRVVGVASTIDNDLYGSDITIGVDTALNVALEAIDRLKVTASSHERAFLIEVMGRQCGYLALAAGVAGGAEYIVLPGIETDAELVAKELRAAYCRGKAHAIVVVAEGATQNADALAHYFTEHRERIGFELRATKLGHIQRGGTPGAFDRLLATRLGAAATDLIAEGVDGVLVGSISGKITSTPLSEVVGRTKPLDEQLLRLAPILAR